MTVLSLAHFLCSDAEPTAQLRHNRQACGVTALGNMGTWHAWVQCSHLDKDVIHKHAINQKLEIKEKH